MARMSWRHIVADTAKASKNHVGERKNHVSEPEILPERIICASMFNDITEYGRKMQGKCLNSAKEVASCTARFRPGCWCFCGPGSEPDLEIPHFANGEWDKLAAMITSEFYHQQMSCVHVFKHASNRYLYIKERETWNACQNEQTKQSHARQHIAAQSTLSVLEVKILFRTRCWVSFLSSTKICIRKTSQR